MYISYIAMKSFLRTLRNDERKLTNLQNYLHSLTDLDVFHFNGSITSSLIRLECMIHLNTLSFMTWKFTLALYKL